MVEKFIFKHFYNLHQSLNPDFIFQMTTLLSPLCIKHIFNFLALTTTCCYQEKAIKSCDF